MLWHLRRWVGLLCGSGWGIGRCHWLLHKVWSTACHYWLLHVALNIGYCCGLLKMCLLGWYLLRECHLLELLLFECRKLVVHLLLLVWSHIARLVQLLSHADLESSWIHHVCSYLIMPNIINHFNYSNTQHFNRLSLGKLSVHQQFNARIFLWVLTTSIAGEVCS